MTVRGTAEQAVHHSELLTGRHLIQTPFRWLLVSANAYEAPPRGPVACAKHTP